MLDRCYDCFAEGQANGTAARISSSSEARTPYSYPGFGFSVFLANIARDEAAIFCPRLKYQKQNPKWILWSVSSLITLKPERGRQSTAQRAKRAEFIERSETVDGRRSGGYRARAKHGRRQILELCFSNTSWLV